MRDTTESGIIQCIHKLQWWNEEQSIGSLGIYTAKEMFQKEVLLHSTNGIIKAAKISDMNTGDIDQNSNSQHGNTVACLALKVTASISSKCV